MVVSLYAAVLAFFYLALTVNVILRRRKARAATGDGGDLQLRQNIAAHSNFSQYTPLFLILLALAESNGLDQVWLHIFSVVFVLGRASHAYGIIEQEKYDGNKLLTSVSCRIRGMVCTISVIAGLAMILIYQSLNAML